MTFKIGDTVKIVDNFACSNNRIGDIGKVVDFYGGLFRVSVEGRPTESSWRFSKDLEYAEVVEYEDKWHSNDGSSTIHDDADKLARGGSVVAYRLRKKEPFKFGDIIKDDFGTVVFLRYSRDNVRFGFVIPEKGIIISWEDLTRFSKVK